MRVGGFTPLGPGSGPWRGRRDSERTVAAGLWGGATAVVSVRRWGKPRPRRQAGAIAIDRADGAHQFATQTLTLPLPVLPLESFTLTVSVVVPFGPDAVFHGRDAGRSPFVAVDTVWPLVVIV